MKFFFPILVSLLYLLGNGYVFYRIWQMMPSNFVARTSLVLIAIIVIVSLFLFFIANDSLPIPVGEFTYKIATSWIFVLLYMLIALILFNLVGLLNKYIHFVPTEIWLRYTKDSWVGVSVFLGLVTLPMIYGYCRYQQKARVPVSISLPAKMSDALSVSPLRIIAISDLHLGYGIGKEEFESWIDQINAENPDIVLISGDIIDNNVRPLKVGNYAESFSKFKAPMGVYACLGNHEYISGINESLSFLKQSGIHLLKDSAVLINDQLYIAGRDDKMNPNRKDIKSLVANLDRSKPIILLDHQPYHLEEAEENGIDIQISGHTHQGQLWPISLITKSLYEVDHGHKMKGNTNIIVSSGIGIWGGKFRIGTQSEYIVIDINK